MAGPTKAQQITKIANELDNTHPGMNLGAEFKAYADSHPKFTIRQMEDGFAAELVAKGVPKAITKSLQAGALATGQAATGASAGAGAAIAKLPAVSTAQAITGIFDTLADGRMWRSLGWIVLGLILIIGGIVLWVKGDITQVAAGLL